MEELFMVILKRDHGNLYEFVKNKSFYLLSPPAKCISQSMLTKIFYENHIFFRSTYDEKNYINLIGKVLELNNNTFQTFIGYKRHMNINIIDQLTLDFLGNDVKLVHIDNVIDESMYQAVVSSASSIFRKEILKKCYSMEDYLLMFDTLVGKANDLSEIHIQISELIERLQNQYILIKGHVINYSMYFREIGSDFRIKINTRLKKFKADEQYNLIIYELAESLIFSRIYPYLYNSIKSFNLDNEKIFRQVLQEIKSNFSFLQYQLTDELNKVTFTKTLNEFKKLNGVRTHFEKMNILSNVSELITKEVNEIAQDEIQRITLGNNELSAIWIYLLANSDLENILTEVDLMRDFSLKDSSMTNDFGYRYLFYSVESLLAKGEKDLKINEIGVSVINAKNKNDAIENYRTYSFASTSTATSKKK